jgi:hypothetical protein
MLEFVQSRKDASDSLLKFCREAGGDWVPQRSAASEGMPIKNDP